MLTKFILYCCPTGPLSVQIEAYFTQAKARFRANPAHNPARSQIDPTAAVAWELRFFMNRELINHGVVTRIGCCNLA